MFVNPQPSVAGRMKALGTRHLALGGETADETAEYAAALVEQ